MFEKICDAKYDTQPCSSLVILGEGQGKEECGVESEKVEFSVPAKRDPEKGIQK